MDLRELRERMTAEGSSQEKAGSPIAVKSLSTVILHEAKAKLAGSTFCRHPCAKSLSSCTKRKRSCRIYLVILHEAKAKLQDLLTLSPPHEAKAKVAKIGKFLNTLAKRHILRALTLKNGKRIFDINQGGIYNIEILIIN